MQRGKKAILQNTIRLKKKKPAYSHMITRETRDGNLNIKNRNGINRWYNLNPVHTINLSLYFQKKKKENDIKYKS